MRLPQDTITTVEIIDGLKKVLFNGEIYISSRNEVQFKSDLNKLIEKYSLNEEQINNMYHLYYNKRFNSK